ncbi:MAG: hypothetical protein HQL86_04855 [Magnetococcales bacterium]|nr:hypothetical protein [Magnetococcales bacterium]
MFRLFGFTGLLIVAWMVAWPAQAEEGAPPAAVQPVAPATTPPAAFQPDAPATTAPAAVQPVAPASTAPAAVQPGAPAAAVKRGGYDPRLACERYAREDGIQANHLADYMNQCLRDLANDQMHAEDAEPDLTDAEADALLNPPLSPKPTAKPAAPAKPPQTGKPQVPARPKTP